MNIAIDTQTTQGQRTGFGTYVGSLTAALQRNNPRGHALTFLKPEATRDLNVPRRLLWDQWGFPRRAQRAHADLLHQPAFSAPLLPFAFRGRVVVTIHDFIAHFVKSDQPFFARQYFARWMPFTWKRADAIITASEYTKHDIVRLLHVPETQITVIPHGVDPKFQPATDYENIRKTLAQHEIKRDYLLHIGTLSPRKNIALLIRVFAQIAKDTSDLDLLLVGKPGFEGEKLQSLTKQLGLTRRVRFLDYLSDNEVLSVLQGAKILALPSLYEGFGLPALEAMACGVPVIASNATSIPEVVGDAGILADPHDVQSWVSAIRDVSRDARLRASLGARGVERAKGFSWDKTAAETIRVYEQTLSL